MLFYTITFTIPGIKKNKNYMSADMRYVLILMLIAFVSACQPPEEEQAQQMQRQLELQREAAEDLPFNFKTDLDSLLTDYFALKNALVESDSTAGVKYAEQLKEQANAVRTARVDPDNEGLWMGISQILDRETDNLINTSDIEEQRLHFEPISEAMIQVVESFHPVGYTIYHQSCPMVRGGSADWLSREEQIANPYHGDRMLRCGETIKQI